MSTTPSGMERQVRVVLITAPDREVGEKLARSLVEAKLAACVSLLPGVTSIYRWEGEIERSEETLLVIKTTADRVTDLTRCAVELHPYDVPEVIALPVDGGHKPYLDWVADESTARSIGDAAV